MRKGFTLIELLIVIAILATLATVTALVLNPAELLRQARDASRVADLASIRSAISLFFATATSTDFIAIGRFCTAACFAGGTVNATTTITGTGWVGVDFRKVSGGSPLAALPLDPVNAGTATHYSFQAATVGGSAYELTAQMESVRYSNGGGQDDVESTDGGTSLNCYETGSDLAVGGVTDC